jgi:hypothetical protein
MPLLPNIPRHQEKAQIMILLDMFNRLNNILVNLPADFDEEIRSEIEYGIYKIICQIQDYERREIPIR